MTPCPVCGKEGRHVAVAFPLLDPGGEVLVTHHCDHEHELREWQEPAVDPARLLALAAKHQGWAVTRRGVEVPDG